MIGTQGVHVTLKSIVLQEKQLFILEGFFLLPDLHLYFFWQKIIYVSQ